MLGKLGSVSAPLWYSSPALIAACFWPLLEAGGLAGWTFSPVCNVICSCEHVRAVVWQAAASKSVVKGCHHDPGSPWRCFPGLWHVPQAKPILEISDTVSMPRAAKSLKPEEHIQGHLEAPAASVGELEEPRFPPVHEKWQQEVLILPSTADGTGKLEELCSTIWPFSVKEAAGGTCLLHFSRDS